MNPYLQVLNIIGKFISVGISYAVPLDMIGDIKMDGQMPPAFVINFRGE
jgi:hypothetical protein